MLYISGQGLLKYDIEIEKYPSPSGADISMLHIANATHATYDSAISLPCTDVGRREAF